MKQDTEVLDESSRDGIGYQAGRKGTVLQCAADKKRGYNRH